ncbi:Predicted membrane protein [bacterium A37T11]|nr:Predicted membrane protein [bacterium A37T11]
MEDNNSEKIIRLTNRLDDLSRRQEQFIKEIALLRAELSSLRSTQDLQDLPEVQVTPVAPIDSTPVKPIVQKEPTPKPFVFEKIKKPPMSKSAWEKFIGENLINKIGILILVIGVAIGAKYSIDHNLISPLTRIILGYLAGIALLVVGMRLKQKYEGFSAVLVSGAMAILYFLTYLAYDMYGLIPQAMTFVLMVVFTAFTVFAAIKYNKQVIAHLGLVGAYAVPFLLSDGSGRVGVLFSYMAIINAGIVVVAFQRYWKPVYYAAFGWTWLIVLSWYATQYAMDRHFGLALFFFSVFFIVFYAAFLSYKLFREEVFNKGDIVLLLANSFIYYGLGYAVLNGHPNGAQLLGVFTVINAVVHFGVSVLIFRKKLADRNLFYLAAGLVLVFITMAIPVQLDGHWVTLLWAGEALLLFWIGRVKKVALYEVLSYPIMLLAFISICQDWRVVYGYIAHSATDVRLTPVLNVQFLSSILFILAFAFINKWHVNPAYPSSLTARKGLYRILSFLLPTVLAIALYSAFYHEISHYWEQRYSDSELRIGSKTQDYPTYYYNTDLMYFGQLWTVLYSLLFLSVLALFNQRKFKNEAFGWINLVLQVVAILVFLSAGLYALSELRLSYLAQTNGQYYQHGWINIGLRYLSYLFVAFSLWTTYRYLKEAYIKPRLRLEYEILLHVTLLWIASSELINWLDIAGSTAAYKLGLSILWGIYSLLLIVLGIWKRKIHLRIGAMILFGITLVKLFIYDIAYLSTIAKTVVFVSLGILLLIISFLYNKFKNTIADEVADESKS